jgi:hypothetical protein
MSNFKRSLARVLAIVLALSVLPATAQWIEQGPGPTLNGQTEGLPNNPVSGAINAIAVDLTRPGVAYLGAVNGGIWKTTTANTATPDWVALTDQQLPALSINSIAISPLDANTIFAGTGSTSSFSSNGSPGFGVARSTDGGATWSVLAGATFTGRRINSIVPTARTTGGLAGQVVLAATLLDGGGVYRSTNGGTSFVRVSGSAGLPNAGASSLVPDPSTNGRLYAGVPGGGGGVFRSDDAGATWAAVNSGLTGIASSSRILLAVGRQTGVVYAMVIDGNGVLSGVFRSANAGATWTAMGVPVPTIHPGGQGLLHAAIVADPTNPNLVYVAGDRQDSPFPNANGCNNFSANTFRGDASLASPWQNVVCNGAQGTSPHADARDMEFDTDGNLLQANDGGINRLENPNLATRRWVSLNGNVLPAEVHSADFDAVSGVVIAGTQDTGTTMQNEPSSLTWFEFLQGDGGVVAVDDTSTPGASIRYTSSQFLGFFNRSTWNAANIQVGAATPLGLLIVSGPGAGQTLFQFDPNIQFYNPYTLNRLDPTRMLIGTATIYESFDRGDTLDNLGFTGKFISSLSYGGRLFGAPHPDTFYVGTSGAGRPYILRRDNLGSALIELAAYPGGGVRDLVMDPEDIRKIYVVDEQDRVWASRSSGAFWQNLTANLPTRLTQVRTIELFSPNASDRDTVLLVGGLGGAFQMRRPGAAGASWTPLSTGLPHGLVFDLRYNRSANLLVAGILGRGAWTLTNFFRGGGGSGQLAAAKTTGVAAGARAQAGAPLRISPGLPVVAPIARPSGDGQAPRGTK